MLHCYSLYPAKMHIPHTTPLSLVCVCVGGASNAPGVCDVSGSVAPSFTGSRLPSSFVLPQRSKFSHWLLDRRLNILSNTIVIVCRDNEMLNEIMCEDLVNMVWGVAHLVLENLGESLNRKAWMNALSEKPIHNLKGRVIHIAVLLFCLMSKTTNFYHWAQIFKHEPILNPA